MSAFDDLSPEDQARATMTPRAAAHFTLTLAADIAASVWRLRPGGSAHRMSAIEYERLMDGLYPEYRRFMAEVAGVEE